VVANTRAKVGKATLALLVPSEDSSIASDKVAKTQRAEWPAVVVLLGPMVIALRSRQVSPEA
jgi:hypothetical protein